MKLMEETQVASMLYHEISKRAILACWAWTSTHLGIASIYYTWKHHVMVRICSLEVQGKLDI